MFEQNGSVLPEKRILITGITSIHGWPVFKHLQASAGRYSVFGIRSPKMRIPSSLNIIPLCITDVNGLQEVRKTFKPTHVVHCAGVCDLDVCEERPQWAYELNTGGSRIIAGVFGGECRIIYLSADLVFSGKATPDGGYTEQCPRDPVSVAGATIAGAEDAIASCKEYCILRLGLPIGDSITGDKGALDFIDNRFRRELPMTLFTDEYRSCITCEDIVRAVEWLIENRACGLYHCGGPFPVSLHEIGEMVIDKGKYPRRLLKGIPRSEEIGGPPRIGNVALNSLKLRTASGLSFSAPVVPGRYALADRA